MHERILSKRIQRKIPCYYTAIFQNYKIVHVCCLKTSSLRCAVSTNPKNDCNISLIKWHYFESMADDRHSYQYIIIVKHLLCIIAFNFQRSSYSYSTQKLFHPHYKLNWWIAKFVLIVLLQINYLDFLSTLKLEGEKRRKNAQSWHEYTISSIPFWPYPSDG